MVQLYRICVKYVYTENMIVGIDEVGRGAWAGPLVVGAVLLGGAPIDGLTDSKLLSKKQRERLDIEIRQKAVAVGLGWVSAKDIDKIGLSQALKLASRRAIAHIQQEYHEIIIDGTIALLDDPRVTLMKKADLLVPSVSAASIVAKVARDNYMRQLDGVFPGYKFAGHVGYGTAAHRAAIDKLGVTPLHRLSFAPLKKYNGQVSDVVTAKQSKSRRIFSSGKSLLSAELAELRQSSTSKDSPLEKTGQSANVSLDATSMVSKRTTKQIGDAAENEAAAYLKKRGHEILARNWRTKFCEIDIVSKYGGTLYFTEVKYRKTNRQGGGLAAITAKKQRQMAFAAEFYAVKNDIKDMNLQLAAADVTGQPPQVKSFLKLV